MRKILLTIILATVFTSCSTVPRSSSHWRNGDVYVFSVSKNTVHKECAKTSGSTVKKFLLSNDNKVISKIDIKKADAIVHVLMKNHVIATFRTKNMCKKFVSFTRERYQKQLTKLRRI